MFDVGSQGNSLGQGVHLRNSLQQMKDIVYDTPEIRGRLVLAESFSPRKSTRGKAVDSDLSEFKICFSHFYD